MGTLEFFFSSEIDAIASVVMCDDHANTIEAVLNDSTARYIEDARGDRAYRLAG